MGGFLSDLKNGFNRGNISLQFIYINAGVFVVTTLVSVFLLLFNMGGASWMEYLELPAYIPQLLSRPWTLFSYMFLYLTKVLHIIYLHLGYSNIYLLLFPMSYVILNIVLL